MLLKIFFNFLKIGAFSIGGGYAMLPLVRELTVKKEKWVSEEKFLELLTLAQGTPGAMAVNLAILIGLELDGLKGALVALSGTIIPSLISITLIAAVLTQFFQNPNVIGFFKGALPAVVGIIAAVVWQLARKGIKTKRSLLFALISFILLAAFKINPILVIIFGLSLVLARIKFEKT